MKLRNLNGPTPMQETDQAIRNLVLGAMELEAPLLNYLEFYGFLGTADTIRTDTTGQPGSFRALNSAAVPIINAAGVPVTVNRKIQSDTIATDRALQDFYGGDYKALASIHENALVIGAKSIARYFTDQLINGDGLLNTIVGLKNVIAGAQLVNFIGPDGGLVPFGNSDANVTAQQNFLEHLNRIIYAMKPSVMVMNSEVQARLESIARTYITVQNLQDAFGVNQRLVSYAGIPIVDAGYQKNETDLVIPQNEVCGASGPKCSSIYFLKCEERDQYTIGTTPGGLKVVHNPKKDNFISTDIELIYEPVIVKAKAAVRLQGIYLA